MKNLNIQRGRLIGKSAYVFCFIALVICGCNKKNDNSPALSGKYSGKFIYTNNSIADSHGEANADITFTNGKYIETNGIYPPPATTSGSYQLKADSITFATANVVPLTLPGSLILLNGTYQYHYEGDSLIVTKTYGQSSFNQYRLKKN
jgi:hypothetical protein